MGKRNYVYVVEERVKGKWVPLAADTSENIATKMMVSIKEFDLSDDERYRVIPYQSTGGGE